MGPLVSVDTASRASLGESNVRLAVLGMGIRDAFPRMHGKHSVPLVCVGEPGEDIGGVGVEPLEAGKNGTGAVVEDDV